MRQMMVLAAVALCVIGYGAAADTAAERAAAQRCTVAKSWCVAALTDPITLLTTHYAMVAALDPLNVRGVSAGVALQIPCEGVTPKLIFWSRRLLTYGDISIRYRIDPGGIVGVATARHGSAGRSFVVDPGETMIDAMTRGEKLTAEVTLPQNSMSSPITFNVKGLTEALRRIKCDWQDFGR